MASDLPIERIEWSDAGSCLGNWRDIAQLTDQDLELHNVSSVGYVVRENDEVVLIVQSLSPDPSSDIVKAADGLRIIKANIISRITLIPSPLESPDAD